MRGLGRRLVIALGAGLGACVAALVAGVLVAAVLGMSIDISRWRGAVADRATAALGQPVRIDGALAIELGRHVTLLAHGVHVLSPPGFAVPELAVMGTLRVGVDVVAALRGRPSLRRIELADGRITAARAAGRAHWNLPALARQPGADGSIVSAAGELELVSVRGITVDYHDETHPEPLRVLDLERVTATAGPRGPLTVEARGGVWGAVPCALEGRGPPISALAMTDRPWPFSLDVECGRARLHAAGALEGARATARFGVGFGTDRLEELELLLRDALPVAGAAALGGEVVASSDAVELSNLRGVVADAGFTGGLTLSLAEARPRVSGEVVIGTLDAARPRPNEDPGEGPLLRFDELAQHPLSLRGPLPLDVELAVRVENFGGVDGAARLLVQADAGGVRVPITGTLAGAALEGRMALDMVAATPVLTLEATADGVSVGALAQRAAGSPPVEGRVGRAALRMTGRGETLGALVRDLEAWLEVTDARLRPSDAAGSNPLELALDAFELATAREPGLRGSGRGTLGGKPVRLTVRGTSLQEVIRARSIEIDLALLAAGVKAGVAGRVAGPGVADGTELAFRLDAPRAGDLAHWASVAPGATMPVSVRGRLRLVPDAWRVEGADVRLGRSSFAVDAERRSTAGGTLTAASVRASLIDVPELATLASRSTERPDRSWRDARFLPHGTDLPDADIALRVERVVFARTELADIAFDARLRDGRLTSSPWAASIAGVPFEGRAAADLRGRAPEVSLAMSATNADVGQLLRGLGVAEIIDERATTLDVALGGRGSTFGELLDHASFTARLTGGNLTVRGPAERGVPNVRLAEAVVKASAGEPVTVRLDGAVNGAPTAITVATGTLGDFARGPARVPFRLEAIAAGTRLALAGEVALPLGRDGELTLELGGERLDSLSGLLGADLPAWGPWSIRGPIAMTPTGYEVSKLAVRVGESRFEGAGRLDLAAARPRLEAQIRAPTVQLDDFPHAPRPLADSPGGGETGTVRARGRAAVGQADTLLSHAFLRRFDATVAVDVDAVLSGRDRLADGQLHLELRDGRLELDPLKINAPGGGAQLYLSLDSNGPGVGVKANARVRRFDYGILARRLRPGADLQGLFSLDLALEGRMPSLDAIMEHADGHMDFAVWPRNLSSGVLDLWSVNIFLALIPFLGADSVSQVNCFVGRLDVGGGRITPDALVIDTTRVRALGSGHVDFRTGEVALRFRPRAKGVAFFSLQTPLSVSGTTTQFAIRATPGDFLEAIARSFASVVQVPIDVLRRGQLPANGADVCTDPLRAIDANRW